VSMLRLPEWTQGSVDLLAVLSQGSSEIARLADGALDAIKRNDSEEACASLTDLSFLLSVYQRMAESGQEFYGKKKEVQP